MKTIFFLLALLSLSLTACTTSQPRKDGDPEPAYRERLFYGKGGM